jgi:ATP-binding cassette subfamily E protein 1
MCPIERQGRQCIDIEEAAKISEINCIGCGICVKSCPFGAITIINIPKELDKSLVVHRFGENGFRLYKLPTLKQGCIMGIIGQNGVGKSTVIKILSNKIQPNFEDFKEIVDSKNIIKRFRGNEIQKYLTKLYDNKLTISVKQQNIDIHLRMLKVKKINITVKEAIEKELTSIDDPKLSNSIDFMDIRHLLDNKVQTLSGGEFQRLLCLITACRNADVFIFDEPTNFLDVKQRLKVAHLIHSVSNENRFVIVIEHDLAILDFISDSLTIMYGDPGLYGVSSMPYGTAEGINSYFSGYLKQENMRFRDFSYDIKDDTDLSDTICETDKMIAYDGFTVDRTNFKLIAEKGILPYVSSITIVLGENGAGKTTFLNTLKDNLGLTISYKPQYLNIDDYKLASGDYPSVEHLFNTKIREAYYNELFKSDIVRPMKITKILSRTLDELSGGELQKVFIILCLGTEAQVYLIDEPSANLDIEQRINVTKMIKKFLLHNRKIGFVVEHDMMMAVCLSQETNSRVIVFDKCDDAEIRTYRASEPLDKKEGINRFLKSMGVTFRTESTNAKFSRPRINKLNSSKDREQKKTGDYYV